MNKIKQMTEFSLKIKETETENMSAEFIANGSKLKLHLFLVNAMIQNDTLAEIITEASAEYKFLKKEQRKRNHKK